ncbi:MAG TPA: GDSL-type esterase/lipase family protein [Opitutaceae bacterium]|nr:GDSL-type esterase/lipase family protein [Opitutaceae bacterium]
MKYPNEPRIDVSSPLNPPARELPRRPASFRCALLSMVAAGVSLFAQSASAIPTVYTCGDSTVQTWASGYYPKAGWGQVLPKYFDSAQVSVVNKAVGGTSSKSFYDNYWTGVKNLLKSGDYAFIQFGINDSASDTARHTDASTTFKDYLRKYVNETKAKGAYPVIVATLRRNAWNSDGTVYDAYHGYPIAAREVAAEMNVPCIDLDGKCRTLMQSLGSEYCGKYWYMNLDAGAWPNYSGGQADNVHFQEAGALEMAKLVVTAIQESSFASLQSLVPAIRPMYSVTFSRNNSNGIVTRTQSFPQGVTVHAQARPNSGFTFSNWSGGLTGTAKISTFAMGTSARSITANFSGGSSTTYQAESGTLSGGTIAESTNSGYRGSGYANFPTTGGVCQFNSVNGGSGGTKTLVIRFANAGGSRTGQLVVNGTTSSITFGTTGSWTTWTTMSVNVTLNSSTGNTLQLKSNGSDLANVDEITIQ